jgi:purine-binding chemotaxis protein CheW
MNVFAGLSGRGDGAEGMREMREADESPAERTRRILRERARLLSRPREALQSVSGQQLLVFSVGGENYGLELSWVKEVLPLPELLPVPHTPAWVAGVTGYRGRVLTVVDLCLFLALPEVEMATDRQRLLVIEPPGMTFGLLVGGLRMVAYSDEELTKVEASGETAALRGVVQGIAPGMVAVLDLPALVRHPEFQVGG